SGYDRSFGDVGSTPADVRAAGCCCTRNFGPLYVRFGSWLCQNSRTRRRRRNILKELHIQESKILHTTVFDALMENCFFYISRMYEFLHRLGQSRRTLRCPVWPQLLSRCCGATIGRKVPKADILRCSKKTPRQCL